MNMRPLASLRTPARATLFYFGTSAVIKALGILMTPVFTRLLTGEEYGIYSLYAALLGIGSIISSAICSGSLIYSGIKKYGAKRFIRSILVISLLLNVVICSVLFAFVSKNPEFSLLILIQLSCDAIIGIYISARRYEYDYKAVCAVNFITAALSVFISLMLISGAGAGYRGRIYGMLIASIIAVSLPLKKLLCSEWAGWRSEEGRYIIDNTVAYMPHALSCAVSSQADKLLVGYFLGNAALGKYSVAHSLGGGLIFAVSAIGSALSPWTVRKLSSRRYEPVRELNRILLILLACGTVMLCAAAPEIMRLLAPKEYSEAISGVFPIALSTLPAFAASVCNIGIIFGEQTRLASRASVICALINLAAGLIFIPTLNYLGAAIALLLTNTALFVLELRYLKKIGFSEIMPTSTFIQSFTVAGVAVLLCAILYNYAWARLLIIIPATVIGIAAALESRRYIFEKKSEI